MHLLERDRNVNSDSGPWVVWLVWFNGKRTASSKMKPLPPRPGLKASCYRTGGFQDKKLFQQNKWWAQEPKEKLVFSAYESPYVILSTNSVFYALSGTENPCVKASGLSLGPTNRVLLFLAQSYRCHLGRAECQRDS